MNLIKQLNRPHPFIFKPSSVILPGAMTFLLLIIFQPFGFWQLPVFSKISLSILLGLIVMLSIVLVVYASKWLLPQWSAEEKWTIGKELLLFLTILLTIAITIFLFMLTLDITPLSFVALFQSVGVRTMMISIFPILILVLYEQNNHQKAQLRRATALNQALYQRTREQTPLPKKDVLSEAILLVSENGKAALQLQPQEVLFLRSDGNYVEVFYKTSPEEIAKKLIRNRLKNLIALLPEATFFHCHKRYVVNVRHIISVEGNARNFELKIRNCDILIPVSRTNAASLPQHLK